MVKEGELMNSKWAQSSIEEALTVLWIPQERNEPTVYLKDHSLFFLGQFIKGMNQLLKNDRIINHVSSFKEVGLEKANNIRKKVFDSISKNLIENPVHDIA